LIKEDTLKHILEYSGGVVSHVARKRTSREQRPKAVPTQAAKVVQPPQSLAQRLADQHRIADSYSSTPKRRAAVLRTAHLLSK
jgi:hypothetical protein